MIPSMGFWLLTPLLLAAAAVAMRPALRRAFGWGAPLAGRAPAGTAPASGEPPGPAAAVPPQPAPPPAQEAQSETAAQPLEPAQVLGELRALQLGLAAPIAPRAEGDRQIAAVIAAIGDPARERRHFPRRPNLLPQLMHAINDETVARRQLVAIIARDPALVDNLLRMANSSFYRISPQPVESIERAVAILGSDGLRSVIATALMQPIFTSAAATEFPRFAQLVWEHALRSAQAAVVHAAVAERTEPFAAELLSLISGLAEIVLFRAVREQCAGVPTGAAPGAALIAALMEAHASVLAQRIGEDWQLSDAALAALAEQRDPATPLGRSLRFGRLAGAIAVLYSNGRIDKATARLSLPRGALPAGHHDTLLGKLLLPFQDPRTGVPAPKRR
jgi:HD-like signal output (HDOD) protein